MTSKELVRRAAHFEQPPRIPLSYPYDLRVSDIVNVEVVRNFMGPDKDEGQSYRFGQLRAL